MRPLQSVKAFANNLTDPNLREAILRIDLALAELYAAVGKLSSGKQANSSNTNTP